MLQLSDQMTESPASAGSGPDGSERSSTRVEWQTIALVAGGVVFSLGNLLHPLEHSDAAYHATTWKAAHLLIFASIPMLVLGLPVLYRKLARRVTPLLATVAIAASIVGLIGIAPGTIIETFVAPMVGHHAMEQLESGGMGVVDAICGIGYIGGAIALGYASHKARLRPRWAGPTTIVAAVVLLAVMGATGPAAGVAIIAATIAYGLALATLGWKA